MAVKMVKPKLGSGWEKCPSIWTEGAPYFWTRRTALGNRQWLLYNTLNRRWLYRVESRRDGRTKTIDY